MHGEIVRLGEAGTRFLSSLPAADREDSQREVYDFVRWCGWEREFAGLTARQVGSYAERLSESDADPARRLSTVRAFLAFAGKQGWTRTNLGTHLRARKRKGRTKPPKPAGRKPVHVSEQGYDGLKAELTELRARRPRLIEDIRRAAADKDFRENAPLDAAREQRGHLEGRIREIEEMLGSAVIIDGSGEAGHRLSIGDSFTLRDVDTGEEMSCTLVGPAEVNAANGRISAASPVGKAALGRTEGDIIQVRVPAGRMSYSIVKVDK